MTNTFTITLSSNHWTWNKSRFLECFPDSFISRALQLDKEANDITISNPVVTSDIMDYLQDIVNGEKPYKSRVNLSSVDKWIPAGRYLMIRLLEVVYHPMFDDFLVFNPLVNLVQPELWYETILKYGLLHGFDVLIKYIWD